MKTTFIIISIVVFIEWIIILIQMIKERPLNHLPRFNYPFEEVCFKINNIKYIERDVVEYTVSVGFFKKPNAKRYVYYEYKFYDRKDKYNIGDKLYLNKK